MEKGPIQEVIAKFRERVDQGKLTDDVKIIYHVAGGMPHQRIEEDYRVSGSGSATLLREDRLKKIPRQEISTQLEQTECRELFQLILSSLPGLIAQELTRFVPDSVVGSLTIEVDGERQIVYFLPEGSAGQKTQQASSIVEVGDRFREIIQRRQEGR